MHIRTLVLATSVALCALAACNKDEPKPAVAITAKPAADDVAPAVKITVDGQVGATLGVDAVKNYPRLDSLVPVAARRVGTWESIEIVGAADPTTIKSPSSAYPDRVAALYLGDKGVAFGMFDPVELAKHGKPELAHQSVKELKLTLAKNSGRGENDHGDGGGTDPTKLVLEIKTKKGTQKLEGTKLLEMTREAPPGDADSHAGWRLLTVLDAMGIKSPKRLLLTDASGTNLTLEKQDLDPASAVPFLKLNRQGTIRFRVFRKQGETWQMGSDLRGLTTIEILE